MPGTQLMLHCGAKEVSRSELATVEAPPPTRTWYPIKHSDVLDAVLETVDQTGFAVEKMRLALSRQGAQFFGTLDLRCPIAEGVTLAVGIRNSINQTLPLGFVAGTRVFVCDNLAFRSELLVSRKHTVNGRVRFREAIAQAVQGLETFRAVESRRVELMRAAALNDVEAESLILRAYERRIVSHRLLPDVIRGWREPGHDDFQARTTWSLYNAFTGALADRARSNPQQHAALTMRLAALLTPSEN
ncbi:MAG: DUF932 domain-containing protein [Caulobacteraceae bacterium]|nr:DUF932 domain-containing protein [Caulobacteraceae bacterium]